MNNSAFCFLAVALLVASACGSKSSPAASGDLVEVSGGTFVQGREAFTGETVHKVTLATFWIGRYEVTQREWQAVMGTDPSRFKGADLPVENVDWADAVDYCNRRSVKEGLTPCYVLDATRVKWNLAANGYRLPTEAEWEYAARGGETATTNMYPGGDDIFAVAWFCGNSENRTHLVGLKQPNRLDLYDMCGNVGEWVWDWYAGYPSVAVTDPAGPEQGPSRITRGGGWTGGVPDMTVHSRIGYNPAILDDAVGFRVARSR